MGKNLSEAAKEARRKYKREWNRKNKDKLKEYEKRYWEKRAAETAGHERDMLQEGVLTRAN